VVVENCVLRLVVAEVADAMNGWNTIRISIMCYLHVLIFISTCSIGALTQANSLPDPHHQYFPPGAFETALPPRDSSRAVWYSCALAALAEPSLYEQRDDNAALQTYRFLWLRSFHRPVSIRLIIDSEGNGVIVTKISDGAGGYKPGKLETSATVEASKRDVGEVLRGLRKLDFWSMPTEPAQVDTQAGKRGSVPSVVELPPVDGAQWILEGAKDGSYHVVDRWSPGNDDYAQECKLLLRLGEVKEKDVY
jgi:hypothetical protein